MLTLLAFPKPFRGHIGIIQRNAIASWTRLRPPCEIVLFGDEEGVADVAKEFGVHHVPTMARNEFGTPLLSDVFRKGEELATQDFMCYVNCDIVLRSDFTEAVKRTARWRPRFLMVGECWNLDVTEPLPFDRSTWEVELTTSVRASGTRRGPRAIDYFVFPRGLYGSLPPFALGRAKFDNWLIWRARNLSAAVVNATDSVEAVHQNHNYAHVAGGRDYTVYGEEALRNLELAGGVRHCYGITESTHALSVGPPRRNWRGSLRVEFRRNGAKQTVLKCIWSMMERTRPLRHRLGLRRGPRPNTKPLVSQER